MKAKFKIGDVVKVVGRDSRGPLKVEQYTNHKDWYVVGKENEFPKILVNVSDMKKYVPRKHNQK